MHRVHYPRRILWPVGEGANKQYSSPSIFELYDGEFSSFLLCSFLFFKFLATEINIYTFFFLRSQIQGFSAVQLSVRDSKTGLWLSEPYLVTATKSILGTDILLKPAIALQDSNSQSHSEVVLRNQTVHLTAVMLVSDS